MKRSLVILAMVFQCAFVAPANAQFSVAGMYGAPNEPGWAVILYDVASHYTGQYFALLLVYGEDGKPIFYAATLDFEDGAFEAIYAGDLYESHGSPLFQPYDANAFTGRRVGRLEFMVLESVVRGSLRSINVEIDGHFLQNVEVRLQTF